MVKVLGIILLMAGPAFANDLVDEADIQILSTNLADNGTRGEWGFSALVKTGNSCLLWDAGRYPKTVLQNAASLGADLSCVDTIVLSHFHFDHTGGLEEILQHLDADAKTNPIRVVVAEGFFRARFIDTSTDAGHSLATNLGAKQWNLMATNKTHLESIGARFVEISAATQVAHGVWATGPVERRYDEQNYPKFSHFHEVPQSNDIDSVPESQGLVVKTKEGPIVLSGCGHSGTVNLLSQVTKSIQTGPVLALMGGLHLYQASPATLTWTGNKLKEIGLSYLMAGHCTGVMPMFSLKEVLGLSRSSAVIGAVGARFVLNSGIEATAIAQ
jgi:7,8-dihydropterin-6-yl-methyl-4-(beta-D-ribofuranosyl)aminobenzene 5'-phosphate synthase